MRAKTSQTSRKRVPEVGRSIEEVILTRKLTEAPPLSSSLAPPNTFFDQTFQSQPPSRVGQNFYPNPSSTAMSLYKEGNQPMNDFFTGEDVKSMMDTLVHYCQALQVRVKELEAELLKQKTTPQFYPPTLAPINPSIPLSSSVSNLVAATGTATSLSVSASVSSFFKDQFHQHGLTTRKFQDSNNFSLSSNINHNNIDGNNPSSTATTSSSAANIYKEKDIILNNTNSNNNKEDEEKYQILANSTKIISNIDKKLNNLSLIFSKNDPIAKRQLAIIIIQKNIRRFLIRCRYLSFKLSLRNWKLIRTSPVIWLIKIINNIKNKKYYLIKNYTIKKKLNFLLIIFKKWKNIYINNKEWRKIIKNNINNKIASIRYNLLLKYFNNFKFLLEKKRLNYIKINNKKNLIDLIRNNLIAKNKLKVVIKDREKDKFENEIESSLPPSPSALTRSSSTHSSAPPSPTHIKPSLSSPSSPSKLSSSSTSLINSSSVVVNGIITDDIIKRIYYNEVLVQHYQRNNYKMLLKYFNILKNYLIDMRNYNLNKAKKFYFQKFIGKVFYIWSDYTYFSNRELVNVNRWIAPRNYIIRYNQKRVDYFSRVRLERKVIAAWVKYTKLSAEVNLKYRTKLTRFLYEHFIEWRKISKKFHDLRVLVYENWKNYSKIILKEPFNMWIEYMKASKTKYYEHSRIATAYRRWKWRQKLIRILKVWRHQSIFGRTDGLYSRQMLLKSLSESKHFIHNLEKLLNEQTLNLDECRAIIQDEVNNKNQLQANILENNLQIESLKLQNHNLKQELLRMNTMMDALKEINPKQFKHLDQLQFSNFQFKERLINYEEIEATVEENNKNNKSNTNQSDNSKISENDIPNISLNDGNIVETTTTTASSASSATDGSSLGIAVIDPVKVIESARSGSIASYDTSGLITPMVEDQAQKDAQEKQIEENKKELDIEQEIDDSALFSRKKKVKTFEESFEEAKSYLTLEDLKLLERAKWIVTRYQDAMDQIIQQDEEREKKATAAEMQMIQSASSHFTSGESSSPNRSQLIISPLTGSPVRTRSRSNSGVDLTLSPGRKTSLTRNSGSLLRRSTSMDESNFAFVQNKMAVEGLEDTVISWAKMLESFLEFITYGEVSLFPSSDKRLWARFLLNQSSVPLNDIPNEVLGPNGEVDGTLSRQSIINNNPNDPPDMLKQIQKAIVTVDEMMHGGKSWKEALMNLRVMFPGPGNFTGHTIKDESDVDTNLFKRFLKMSKDIQQMEEQQSLRFNKPTMESQRGVSFSDSPNRIHRKRLNINSNSNDDQVEFQGPAFNIYSSNLASSLKNMSADQNNTANDLKSTYVPLRIARKNEPANTGPPPLSVSSSGASLFKTLGLDDDKRKIEEELEAIRQQQEALAKVNQENNPNSIEQVQDQEPNQE